MPSQIPDDFEQSLTIALRMIPQSPRTEFSGKLPDQRDRGSRRIAAKLVEQLRLQGWIITPGPLPGPPVSR
jgi:hypothetical protein